MITGHLLISTKFLLVSFQQKGLPFSKFRDLIVLKISRNKNLFLGGRTEEPIDGSESKVSSIEVISFWRYRVNNTSLTVIYIEMDLQTNKLRISKIFVCSVRPSVDLRTKVEVCNLYSSCDILSKNCDLVVHCAP